jgi:hypothetical protein
MARAIPVQTKKSIPVRNIIEELAQCYAALLITKRAAEAGAEEPKTNQGCRYDDKPRDLLPAQQRTFLG